MKRGNLEGVSVMGVNDVIAITDKKWKRLHEGHTSESTMFIRKEFGKLVSLCCK